MRRLFPTAYHDDAERDREYQQLVRDELLDRRLAALDIVDSHRSTADELDEAQLSAWMRRVNDLRLVLGTRLDVCEDRRRLDADDPDAPRSPSTTTSATCSTTSWTPWRRASPTLTEPAI